MAKKRRNVRRRIIIKKKKVLKVQPKKQVIFQVFDPYSKDFVDIDPSIITDDFGFMSIITTSK